MGVRLRDDVIASAGLVPGTDRWVGIDLLAGVAGYVVWVAGSAALGMQVASLADYAVTPGGTPTTAVLALLALLWLVLPAALGVARVRSRLLNLRNNIDQEYRLDRPAALLVPPAVLVGIFLVTAVAMGTVSPLLFVGLAPATLYFLVRTTAYSYRVYAFSHPVIPYAGLFLTLVVQAGTLLLYLGMTTENEGVVRGTIDELGLPVDPLGATEIAGLTVPTGLTVAVAVPIAVVVAYLLVQTVAALVVRVREPTIKPADTRTGQRYPPWLEVTSNGGRSSPTKTSAGAGATSSDATAAAGAGADSTSTSNSRPASGSSSTGTGSTADSAAAADADGTTTATADTEADPAAEDADSVSHTRVFTPPDGGGDDPLSPTGGDAGDPCPDCGATVPDGADRCPACGADAA